MENAKFRKELIVALDQDGNPILVLDDWEHRDYIEDVLCEHFDIEYEYTVEDEVSGKYTLYFGTKVGVTNLQGAIKEINHHHSSKIELYNVV
ncbi:hypothetical protein [Microbulbifer sp. JMSA002]|uniref:hypothetical protein n=1 Tax=Microbulbifer sp. JMSA002 TaxID=3243368 RepID=UPI0040396BCA